MAPELDLQPSHDVDIAPWLDRSDSESQEPIRLLHPTLNEMLTKGSFSSLRPGSSSGLFSRQRDPSESHSNLIAETTNSVIASTSTSAMQEPRVRSFSPSPEVRKSKSSMFRSLRKKLKMPKRNMRSGSGTAHESEHSLLRVSPGSSLVSLDPAKQETHLDTDFDEMNDIIYPAPTGKNATSPLSNGFASSQSDSDSDSSQFHLSNSYQSRHSSRPPMPDPQAVARVTESWSVADPVGEAEWKSDDSTSGTGRHSASVVPASHHHGAHVAAARHKMQIRIYRSDNTYHVVSVSTGVTVAALKPKLDMKLPVGEEREMYRVYLKERGRERILAQTERHADIVRRRLEQAGYDEADGEDLLGGSGLSFLLRFVYKTLFLGLAEEGLKFDNFEYIDLTGRTARNASRPNFHLAASHTHTAECTTLCAYAVTPWLGLVIMYSGFVPNLTATDGTDWATQTPDTPLSTS
ncbi:hypothetical protein C8R44DRAFT_886151 [Mycena epipterygia]|nr:hypothetical protein C8R44DRAFT_886151 [Mycena epipterygia]